MKNILLTLALLIATTTLFSANWVIKNSGNTFTPSTITIQEGDDVTFDIGAYHDAVEVSEATYNANGVQRLSNGFKLPFGGGDVESSLLTPGTHYYICTPHVTLGMKGTIIVEAATNIQDKATKSKISIYPNPSQGVINIALDPMQFSSEIKLTIYNVLGEAVHQSIINDAQTVLDLNDQPSGLLFINVQSGSRVDTQRIVIQ